MAHLMSDHYPLLPHLLLRYPLETCRDAGRVRSALLLVHGEQDTLIRDPAQRTSVVASAAGPACCALPGQRTPTSTSSQPTLTSFGAR
jgi:hypothetical protein